MEQLSTDLKHQDKIELELKRIKADNQDLDGKNENEVRRQLRMIKKKYGLEDIDDFLSKDGMKNNDIIFKDKKLDNLWKKINKLDLNEEQLKILKEELNNFGDNLNEYHKLAGIYDTKQQKSNYKNDENHIDSLMNLDLDTMDEKLRQKHIELKDHYRRINDMVYSKDMLTKTSTGDFEEEQVARLWQMALKSDFNEEELVTLKEKLLHYENRIKKLNYFQGQLAKSNQRRNNEINDDPNSINQQQHEHIVSRVQELDSHVKKLQHQLEQKILSKHYEL